MTWYPKDHDPFDKIGFCRIIVLKHENMGRTWRGDNLTTLLRVDAMTFNFISEGKSDTCNPCLRWLEEDIAESCDHKINHIFSKMNNGLYEMIGDVYHWSSRSWEGEWDGDTEIRDYKIQEISFNTAARLMDDEYRDDRLDLIYINLYYGKDSHYYSTTSHISPYMTRKQILVNHAVCLENLINRGRSGNSTYQYDMMKEKQIEDTIHMLMLEADMSTSDEIKIKAQQIDTIVNNTLKLHNDRMVPEE